MRHILKLLLITLLLGTTLFADEFKKPPYDKRLDLKVDGKLWYENADTNSDFAYNLGVYYDQYLKEYKTAEFWYKKSWSVKPNKNCAFNLAHIYNLHQKKYIEAIEWYKKASKLGDGSAAFSLGLLYENSFKDYSKAIKWYETAYTLNNYSSLFNLALLYEDKLNNYKQAIKWYKEAIQTESLDAMKNLALLYKHKLKDDIKAVEYFTPLIDKKYPKKKVLTFFKQRWKLSDKTIKQGYEAQLKSKIIPEKLKYKGEI
jgi:uncharacterized protein